MRRDLLLVLWVALLGTTRVDFLAGVGPMVLTPYLVLTPIVIVYEGFQAWSRRRRLGLPRGFVDYLTAVSALLLAVLVSTLFSYDLATSGRRFALLLFHVSSVILVGAILANRPEPGRVLLGGATLGLALTVAFNVALLVGWVFPSLVGVLPPVLDLTPDLFFGVIPRLSGGSHDPNHGGLIVVFYLWLLRSQGPLKGVQRTLFGLGVVFIVVSLSRSAALAGVAVWGLTALRRSRIRVSASWVRATAAVLAVITVTYLAVPAVEGPVADLGEMLSGRLSIEDGSTSDHAKLMVRGWEVATQDLKNFFLGIGYGNAYVEVQDLFPGNTYGNFHSLFLTMFAESGAFAFLVTVLVFGAGLSRSQRVAPMVAGLIAFNLFQQAHDQPLLWLTLLIAWAPSGFSFGNLERGGLAADGFEAGAAGVDRRVVTPELSELVPEGG